MRLRHALGKIGRQRRSECAQHVSSQLEEKLWSEPDAPTHQVRVTDHYYLNAFKKRPLSPSPRQQITKLVSRIRRELNQYDVLVAVNHDLLDGRFSFIEVSVAQSTTPRRPDY